MARLTRGERFKDARTVHNKHGSQTMAEVYNATGVSASLIKELEDESERDFGYKKVAKLAVYYGVSVDWLLGLTEDHSRIPSAIDQLGLSDKVIKWFAQIKTLKNRDVIWDINPVFENTFFQCLVYSVLDYFNAAQAEEIYDRIHNQFFDFDNVEYSAEDVEKLRKRFDTAVLDIAESGKYGPSISTYLRAHNQLWGNDTSAPDLTALIASVSGIADISAYGANKALVNLLESMRETAKKEVTDMMAEQAEG